MILHLAALLLAISPGEGQQLFNVHCASCHGLNLQGSAQGPPLINVAAGDVDFELRTGRMPARIPDQQQYRRAPYFAQAQIAAIVDYVMSRSSGEKQLPIVQLPGNLEHGRRVFEENCEHCHSATGHGDSVGYRDVAPSLMDSDPLQIAEAVRMGPNVMPQFGPKLIDNRSLADVITYVEFLQHGQYNPGGLQLANYGPVPEGFIAWTVGLGLLVLLARRIGSTD